MPLFLNAVGPSRETEQEGIGDTVSVYISSIAL